MSSKFPEMAAELIQQVSSTLRPADLGLLRLTCRTINQVILQQFGATNFTTVRTDLTPRSLQKLQDISLSEFARFVECLHLTMTVDDTPQSRSTYGKGLQWHRHSSGYLIPPFPIHELLSGLLIHKFLKCRSFYIEIFDEGYVGTLPYVSEYIRPSDAVGILLSIIAETGLAAKSFVIRDGTDGGGASRLDTPRLQIPYSNGGRQFENGWVHLHDLTLQYGMTHDQEDWAFNLVKTAPILRRLTLSFFEEGELFLSRLAGVINPNSTLEHLSIKSAHVPEHVLSTILFKTQHSLRSLFLRSVHLGNVGAWAKLFKGMKGSFPRLSSLELCFPVGHSDTAGLSNLLQYPKVLGSEVKKRVGKEYRLKADSRCVEGLQGAIDMRYKFKKELILAVGYKGPDMDVFLGVLTEAAIKSL